MNNSMVLSEEKINSNFVRWIDCLEKYNCYSQEMIDDIGEKIKNASFAMNENTGGAYQGSLLDVVLSKLCVIAIHINDCAFGPNPNSKIQHPELLVDKNSLMKVLLLQHISKAELYVSTKENWKINKGFLYDFNDNLETSLKLGERSIYLCMKYGIKLTEEEYDAMRIVDKDEDKNNSYVTPLAELVKVANQLTCIEIYRKYNKK